ncbi:Hypothetical predicted protein [Olea europaea subsp. europaea]|uniref:Uncharacterized protein n=1 Tax=Olea europaea subsp. europaea TaxID=158383 RepID=A0A8S0PPH0_OLEEU|nr:Hypothetical predicted protein [Olea europaea subsp. europaea]
MLRDRVNLNFKCFQSLTGLPKDCNKIWDLCVALFRFPMHQMHALYTLLERTSGQDFLFFLHSASLSNKLHDNIHFCSCIYQNSHTFGTLVKVDYSFGSRQ